jgi:HNH endonuclease
MSLHAYKRVLRGDPCSYCGRPSESTDHIEPWGSGGEDDWTNLTASCISCNSSKGTQSLLPWLASRLPVDVGSADFWEDILPVDEQRTTVDAPQSAPPRCGHTNGGA